MDRTPRILVAADEPMFVVNLMFELEGRGFAVEPVNLGEYGKWQQPYDVDAAVFDLHRPDENSLQFASKLGRTGVPVVALGRSLSLHSARIAAAETCLSKPVDYDRLAAILHGLVSRRPSFALPAAPEHVNVLTG